VFETYRDLEKHEERCDADIIDKYIEDANSEVDADNVLRTYKRLMKILHLNIDPMYESKLPYVDKDRTKFVLMNCELAWDVKALFRNLSTSTFYWDDSQQSYTTVY
jgi:hypothetical protein